MAIPKFVRLVTGNRELDQIQSNVSQSVNPILANPLTTGSILTNINLITGSNTINHKLGRALQGWFIIRQRNVGSIYDLQDSNPLPQFNLILQSSAPVVVDIYVF